MPKGMNKTGCILVAEDDRTDAFFLQRAFKRAGIPVNLEFVRDGQEVIDYLQGDGEFENRAAFPLPQLLMLDLNMPRLSGFEVLAWIRKHPRWKDLPVAIFSASDEPKDIRRAYDLGANSYLVKPHSIDELMNVVGQLKKHWAETDKDHGRKAA